MKPKLLKAFAHIVNTLDDADLWTLWEFYIHGLSERSQKLSEKGSFQDFEAIAAEAAKYDAETCPVNVQHVSKQNTTPEQLTHLDEAAQEFNWAVCPPLPLLTRTESEDKQANKKRKYEGNGGFDERNASLL